MVLFGEFGESILNAESDLVIKNLLLHVTFPPFDALNPTPLIFGDIHSV